MFTRKITEIEKITDTNYLISVDGISDLHLLKSSESAKIKGFLPGTTNSSNQIYIPSDQTVSDEPRTFDIPHLQEDTLTDMSKIDWLLTDEGDVVLNSFGEAGLAAGTNNLIQALKMKIKTEKGKILSSPGFGLGLKVGVNVTDITVGGILEDLKAMIVADSRFSGVEKIEIVLLPPDLAITVVAILAGGRGIFPINFTV